MLFMNIILNTVNRYVFFWWPESWTLSFIVNFPFIISTKIFILIYLISYQLLISITFLKYSIFNIAIIFNESTETFNKLIGKCSWPPPQPFISYVLVWDVNSHLGGAKLTRSDLKGSEVCTFFRQNHFCAFNFYRKCTFRKRWPWCT